MLRYRIQVDTDPVLFDSATRLIGQFPVVSLNCIFDDGFFLPWNLDSVRVNDLEPVILRWVVARCYNNPGSFVRDLDQVLQGWGSDYIVILDIVPLRQDSGGYGLDDHSTRDPSVPPKKH